MSCGAACNNCNDCRRPGGAAEDAEKAALRYLNNVKAIFDSDPVRAVSLIVGGAPGALIVAYVENKGDISKTMHQSACDLTIVYTAAAVIVPIATTIALGPVGLVVGGVFGALSALIAAMCDNVCKGTKIPDSVVDDAILKTSGAAGLGVSQSDINKIRGALPQAQSPGAKNVMDQDQIETQLAHAFFRLATDPSKSPGVVAGIMRGSVNALLRSNTSLSEKPRIDVAKVLAVWDSRGNPRDQENALDLIHRHMSFVAFKSVLASLGLSRDGDRSGPGDQRQPASKGGFLAVAAAVAAALAFMR